MKLLICSMLSFDMILHTAPPVESCTTILMRTDNFLLLPVLHANVCHEVGFRSGLCVAAFFRTSEPLVFMDTSNVFSELAVSACDKTAAKFRAAVLAMNSPDMLCQLMNIAKSAATASRGAGYSSC